MAPSRMQPKISAFPKCYIEQIAGERSMTVFQWIEMARSLDADGLYFNGSGPATDWNLFIYNDASGKPGSIVASATARRVRMPRGSTPGVRYLQVRTGIFWVSRRWRRARARSR